MEAGLVAVPFVFAYEHRLIHFSATSALAIATLFLATEFAYYWQHRLSHRIRWLWAIHSVHHSPTKMNLIAAVRIGWTGNIAGNFLFFVPLAFIGFHPFAILGMLAATLLYRFFIYTGLASNLRPFARVLNTPAHHRVHHALNASCLDKNFGGVLIIFDRLFGTFAEAPKGGALCYRRIGEASIRNPLHIVFHEWVSMWRDVKAARSLVAKLGVVVAPPSAGSRTSQSTGARGSSVSIPQSPQSTQRQPGTGRVPPV